MSTPPDNLDVWVLAGQSNMQGCGYLQGALEPDERVWNFSSAGNWQVAAEPLHRLWESYTPVHQNLMRNGLVDADRELSNEEIAARDAKQRQTGAGLGIAFGTAMADATGMPVGLLAAAHGGTSLEQWSPSKKEEGGDSLYGAMLDRIRKAGGNLRGVLWYQGESDCGQGSDETYAARFENWVESLRADLDRPELPVIAVQLGRVLQPAGLDGGWAKTSWEIVREAQRLLPEQLPHTAVTSAIDLGLADTIHIDSPGLIRLGKRMARLACPMQLGAAPTSPRLVRVEAGGDNPHGFGMLRVICEGVQGGWNPRHHISGFELRSPAGQLHPEAFVISADGDALDPKIINVMVSTPLGETLRLGYGLGLNPYCNAVDDGDQPLPAFLPQPVSGVLAVS